MSEDNKDLSAQLSDSYVLKKLLTDQKGLFINQIKEILEHIPSAEFHQVAGDIINTQDSESLTQLNYYLMLFKDVPRVQKLLLDTNTPVKLLESLLLFAYSSAVETRDDAAAYILDKNFYYLTQDKYLDLLLNSSIVANDTYLSYYILTKMDKETLEKFFEQKENLKDFIIQFNSFPENEAKSIILRNPELFGYIVMYLHIFDSGDIADDFTQKYESDIVEMEKIKKISIQSSMVDDEEGQQNLGVTSSKRLQFLIKELLKLQQDQDLNQLLENEELFINKKEQVLVKEILSNPLYKDILNTIKNDLLT